MRKILLLLVLIILYIPGTGMGQEFNFNADSLKRDLKLHANQDTNRVLALTGISTAYLKTYPDSSITYINEALKISQAIHWQKGIALSCKLKGNFYQAFSDDINAIDYYSKALKADSNSSKPFTAAIYGDIGTMYFNAKQYAKALDNYYTCLHLARQAGLKENTGIAMLNIASLFSEIRKNDSSVYYYAQARLIAEANRFTSLTGSVFNGLGNLYYASRRFDSSIYYYQKSIELSSAVGDLKTEAKAWNGLGLTYIELQNFSEAAKCCKRSLAIGSEQSMPDIENAAWITLWKIYKTTGKYKLALEAYMYADTLSDIVMNEAKKSETGRREMQYRFNKTQDSLKVINDKKQALAAASLKQETTIRNAIIAGAILIIIAGLLLFNTYKKSRQAKEKQHEAELLSDIAETELKALRAQMNPHFIFNSLNSISDYISKNNIIAADNYLSSFAKLMRLVLENSEKKEVPLSDDLKALELYMQLEALRMKNKFTWQIMVSDEIDAENSLLPPLILQPFVENSIWHGISSMQGDGIIKITIGIQQDMLHCLVEDNGIGRNHADIITKNFESGNKRSMAMKITQQRLDILNQEKHTHARIELNDLKPGLSVAVILPLEINI